MKIHAFFLGIGSLEGQRIKSLSDALKNQGSITLIMNQKEQLMNGSPGADAFMNLLKK